MTKFEKRAERILIVDDDPRIRQMVTRYFEDEGFLVTGAQDGASMRKAMADFTIDLILLDLVLPNSEDGLALAREIRATSDVPIVMLTGRDDVVDRIIGLEVGADDYIPKPFHLREVLARVRSILRRRKPAEAPVQDQGQIYEFDGWRLEINRRRLMNPQDEEVELTTGEFDMLAVMIRNAGRVLTREMLMDQTRGRQLEAFDRAIDAQIARLRKKIEPNPAHPVFIRSVRGVGYIFAAEASSAEARGT
ncbi:two-component system, OmpR family, phosphate regulon response regulator OmpR [Rhizobium sp. RU35A]|uniref:Regulatory protein VirG n=1 Tax=Rhizobium straminoryzae TaxID=1387186 RepID=A0A549TAB5_9HYPH|nr:MULTISPECIES: response regulator [Rhizobium]TRL38810.1 response regulator [Rhizobium straminoryzae]SIQ11513.1 two-component system, OmpR family, phosphate regulon response regulator OmpR [Rhizobium sp. RU35A]